MKRFKKNPVAKILRTSKFRMRVVKNIKKYTRKRKHADAPMQELRT